MRFADDYPQVRLKSIFRIVNGATPSPDPINWDGGIYWATPQDLGALKAPILEKTARTISAEGLASCATEVAPADSLVLSTRAPIGHVARSAVPLAINQGCRLLIPRRALSTQFYLYVLLTQKARLNSLGRGSTFAELSTNDLGNLRIPNPPIDEQERIVRFLEGKASKIDTLLDKKQQLLLRADEHRRSLVSYAVRKGVDSEVPMRPSEVAWLGDIPKHWDVRRVKHVARLASGHTPSRDHPEYWIDPTIPWFQLTDIWRFRDDSEEVVTTTAEMISEFGLRNSAAELLPAGTVALSRTASVGFSAILGQEMATTQDFANWVPGPLVESSYLLYVLRAMRSEFERLRFGSTHKTIYMSDIGKLVMPLPPIEEQRAIVHHIKQESTRLLLLRRRIIEAIDRFREFREGLISATIMGQFDVVEAA